MTVRTSLDEQIETYLTERGFSKHQIGMIHHLLRRYYWDAKALPKILFDKDADSGLQNAAYKIFKEHRLDKECVDALVEMCLERRVFHKVGALVDALNIGMTLEDIDKCFSKGLAVRHVMEIAPFAGMTKLSFEELTAGARFEFPLAPQITKNIIGYDGELPDSIFKICLETEYKEDAIEAIEYYKPWMSADNFCTLIRIVDSERTEVAKPGTLKLLSSFRADFATLFNLLAFCCEDDTVVLTTEQLYELEMMSCTVDNFRAVLQVATAGKSFEVAKVFAVCERHDFTTFGKVIARTDDFPLEIIEMALQCKIPDKVLDSFQNFEISIPELRELTKGNIDQHEYTKNLAIFKCSEIMNTLKSVC